MFTSIHRYAIDPSAVQEVLQQIEDGFVPILSQAPGFITYYALDAGDGVIASISVFKDKISAEESNHLTAEWAAKTGVQLQQEDTEVTSGEVLVHKMVRQLAALYGK